MPGEVVWWLGKPGGQPESAHRLRKLMVRGTHWRWTLAVLGDVRRDPEIRVILSPNCNQFNHRIKESLDNANFVADGEGEFDSMYLEDIEDADPWVYAKQMT